MILLQNVVFGPARPGGCGCCPDGRGNAGVAPPPRPRLAGAAHSTASPPVPSPALPSTPSRLRQGIVLYEPTAVIGCRGAQGRHRSCYYEPLLAPLRQSAVRLLEVGVEDGRSLTVVCPPVVPPRPALQSGEGGPEQSRPPGRATGLHRRQHSRHSGPASLPAAFILSMMNKFEHII